MIHLKKAVLFLILLSPMISFADTTTPNMGLQVNPSWPSDLQSDMSIIDAHNHSSGSGEAINPGGINITAPLPFNGHPATSVDYVGLIDAGPGPSVPITAWSNGVDLFYEDGNGNKIQLTANGAVNGSLNIGDAGYFVPGYASTSIDVDGGVYLVKDGGCFVTSNGVSYCDDGLGDAVINAALNQYTYINNGGANVMLIGPNEVYLTSPIGLSVSGKIQAATTQTATLIVNEGAFVDGGLSVYGGLRVDGGIETTRTISSAVSVSAPTISAQGSYSVSLISENVVGPEVASLGPLVLAPTNDHILTLGASGVTTCGSINGCWGSGATCTMGIAANDANGTFSINTASSTAICDGGAPLVTITYGATYNILPATIVQLSGDSDAGAVPVLPAVFPEAAVGDFVMSDTAYFTPNTLSSYTFSYIVLGTTDGGF